jgi:CDP-paratose synthetase
MPLQPQNIAVTGASGFIGQHVINRLHTDGHRVCVITRPSSKLPKELSQKVTPIVFNGDVSQLTTELKKRKVTGMIHLASLFLAQHTAEDISELIQSNVLFGTQLLEASVQSDLKWFMNTGTFWQHYQDASYSPVNLYAATKQAFLAIAQYYYETHPLNFLTLELSDTFGPNDPRPKLISLWQKIATSGETLGMSAGEQYIDLNYVENVIDAFVHAMTLLAQDKKLQYKGKSYAISSGRVLPLKELAPLFQKVTGKKLNIEWGQKPYRPREVMRPWSLGQSLPGWQPKVSLEEGLRKTLASKKS